MSPETCVQKSELEVLLEKNAYGLGLTTEESKRAIELIRNPVYSEENCWVCKAFTKDDQYKAIYDTNLCQQHALYALATRK